MTMHSFQASKRPAGLIDNMHESDKWMLLMQKCRLLSVVMMRIQGCVMVDIVYMATHPSYQGCGLGSVLMVWVQTFLSKVQSGNHFRLKRSAVHNQQLCSL